MLQIQDCSMNSAIYHSGGTSATVSSHAPSPVVVFISLLAFTTFKKSIKRLK